MQTKATFHKYYDIRNEAFHINKRAVNYFLDCSFLCRPIWGNATVSAFLQQNIRGNGVPLHYTTVEDSHISSSVCLTSFLQFSCEIVLFKESPLYSR